MAFVLRIEKRKSGAVAKAAFDLMESGNATISIPGMVFAEVLYLSEAQRIGISLADVSNYLRRYPNCKEHPLDFAVIESASRITDIGDLHDRLIAATALLLKWPLITNDPVVQASTWVSTVW
jgi:predicted nucleic acid-binding protein